MRITFVGVGKLGLGYAAHVSSKGHQVHCVDINENFINSYSNGNFLTDEPKVSELATKFPMTYSTNLKESDLTIILVNTPTCYAGYDHSILEKVLSEVTGTVVVASTVQPGFCDRYGDRLIYNPLFVQIGNVIEYFETAQNILVGGPNGVLEDFFRSIYNDCLTIHYMSYMEAEVAKLALNSFITTKISFANMIGDSLRRVGKPADTVLNFI
jgi:UDP-glucose 6-dehydrogenase